MPRTVGEVDLFAKYALEDLEQAEKTIQNSQGPVLNPSNHRLMQNCALKTTLLGCLALPSITLPISVKESAGKHAETLRQRYVTFLKSLPESSMPRPQVTCVKGLAASKPFPGDRKISVLSWNICCLGGGLPMLFGGARPWPERINGIAGQILAKKADIVCLQEVFSEDVTDALYDRLKDKYAHFYLNIGPREYSFDLEKIGRLSSGLFVASKYPLDNPRFYPYDLAKRETEAVRGYGIFMGDLFNRVCIATSHLQPGDSKEDRKIRTNQLAAVYGQAPNTPTCLFADTNINNGSDEYEQEIIPRFINHYNRSEKDWTCCELREAWLHPDQYSKALAEGSLPFRHIDAILEIKRDGPPLETKCEVVPVGELDCPEKALSDHRALYSTINLP